MEGGADPSFSAPMAACLTEDNFVLYSTALIAANAGAVSEESRGCLTDLGRSDPAFAYATLGVAERSPVPFDPEQLLPFARDFYDCFTTSETVQLTLQILDQVSATAPITGRDFLNAMGDDVINCYLDALGLDRDQFEVIVETTFAAGTASTAQAPDCLTKETLAKILVTITASLVGGLSSESADCVRAFGMEHPEYMELMAIGDFDAASTTEEQFVELAAQGLDVFECLTTSEFLPIQSLIIALVT